MKKHSLTILLLSLFSVFFSQEMSRIKVDLNKLDFNTKLSEISSDYVDGNLIYFQNKKAIKKYSEFYDLFMLDSSSLASSKGDRKKVSLTKQLTIVTDYHEGPCFVDEENDRIYITISSLDKKGMKREKKLNNLNKNRLRIVEGDFKNGIISNLKEFEHNNPIYNVGHASYSKFTKRLYFISTMPGTIGGSDIFYSVKKTDGSWGKPINVGRRINSGGSELFPYAKNGILFFTSNGQKNQVGQDLDIYFIKESELTTKNPTALVGANSSYDDYAVCFNNNEGEYEGFFTSNRDNKFSGNDDVYGFKITNVEYSKTYDLLVNVTNNDKLLRTGQLTLMNSEGEELETVGIKKEGFNLKALEKGKEYQLAYSNSDFSRIFDLPINYYSSFVAESFDIETDAIFKDTLLVDNIDVLVNKLDSTEKIVAKVEPNVKVISNPEIITNLDPKVSVIENPQVVAKVEPNVKVIEDPEVIAKVEPKVLLKVEDKIPLKKDPIKPKVVDPLIIADTA
ncbi:MAG: hypothetical protein ABF240_00705, partial [Flavobacteriales bacterium]